ncbi:potassium channel family protein [Microbacterium sp. Marseille-Q6648]|uniref:potassium channel family protein n=1 Tax=Microbacterium sp. Marseille-Q6648 TaxID=2937991 RepID=UPI00203B1C1A|nr:potassium channel family protein [Microbacterium sp. Marseille-Q6648]
MVIVSNVIGTALILIALNDVFQTLLRPSATGRLTHVVFRLAWALARRRRRSLFSSGALTVLMTIAMWLALVTVGWALVYLPHVPEGFSYSGVDPERYVPFVEALTFSMVALTTLGLGDVIPAEPWIRALSPLEALTMCGASRRPRCSTTSPAATGTPPTTDRRWGRVRTRPRQGARGVGFGARAHVSPPGCQGGRSRGACARVTARRRARQACRRRSAETTSSCQRRAAGSAPVKTGVSWVTPW